MKSRATLLIGAAVALLFLALTVWFQVAEHEKAVVLTFGRPGRVLGPGLNFKLPGPIQTVQKFDVRIRTSLLKFEQTLTRDAFQVLASGAVCWRIKNPILFMDSFSARGDAGTAGSLSESSPRERAAIARIINKTESSRSAVFGRYALSDIINQDPAKVRLQDIEKEIATQVRTELDPCGIEVVAFFMSGIDFPEETTGKVFERMQAERQRVANQYQKEGKRAADRIRSEADTERERILAEARAKATAIRAQGDAEAAACYDAYRGNEDLAVFLRKRDALQRMLQGRTTVILDTDTPGLDLFRGATQSSAGGTAKP